MQVPIRKQTEEEEVRRRAKILIPAMCFVEAKFTAMVRYGADWYNLFKKEPFGPHIHHDVTPFNFPVRPQEDGEIEVSIVKLLANIDLGDLAVALGKLGLRYLQAIELFSLCVENPDLPRRHMIPALESKRETQGGICVPEVGIYRGSDSFNRKCEVILAYPFFVSPHRAWKMLRIPVCPIAQAA